MAEASDKPDERARKNFTAILQRLSSVGQVALATGLNVSEASISRWKSDQAEQCAKALAILGLKVVPIEMRCFDPKKIGAILALAKAHLSEIDSTEQLQWED